MNINQCASERYRISPGGQQPQPWISTVERYHHHLLVELLPAPPPSKAGLRLGNSSSSGDGSGSSSGSAVPGSPLKSRKAATGTSSGGGGGDQVMDMYQWRMSLWKSPEQRLTCDVYTNIELDTQSSSSAGNDNNSSSGSGSGGATESSSSPQPPSRASRRAYRQSKPNQLHQHQHQHQHSLHRNSNTVYVVDLDFLSTLLLPGSALDSGGTLGGDSNDHNEGNSSRDRDAAGGNADSAAAAAAVAWVPQHPIHLVVEMVHVASGLVLSRGSASFRMAESGELEFPIGSSASDDANAARDGDGDAADSHSHSSRVNDLPPFTTNSCYLVDVVTDTQQDRQLVTDAIIASQRDAKRASKNAITRCVACCTSLHTTAPHVWMTACVICDVRDMS